MALVKQDKTKQKNINFKMFHLKKMKLMRNMGNFLVYLETFKYYLA